MYADMPGLEDLRLEAESVKKMMVIMSDHMVRLHVQILSYIGRPFNSGGWVKI